MSRDPWVTLTDLPNNVGFSLGFTVERRALFHEFGAYPSKTLGLGL